MVSVFTALYQAESLVDVSLAAEGKVLQAHKVVLSACSEYFQLLFDAHPCQHPIVILKDVKFDDLQTVVKFMYHGCVNVSSDKLPAVLQTADALQIKGLENKELMDSFLGNSRENVSRQASLLSVPGQARQPSTDSLPDYLLQRSRSEGAYFPARAHSAESRGMSLELPHPKDTPPALRPKRLHSPPPAQGAESPSQLGGGSPYQRKKFRNRSEKERESTQEGSLRDATPPPATKLEHTPSQESSYQLGDSQEHIAKKKRAMFQARKGGSSSGSKSSEMQNSSIDGRAEKKGAALESESSSSLSISHSSDREELQSKDDNTLQVPSIVQSRTMVRAASAGESAQHSALATKFKRGRFLQRQQCQEAETNQEPPDPPTTEQQAVTRSEPPPSPPAAPQQLVKQHSSPLLSAQTFPPSPRSSPPPKTEPPDPLVSPPLGGTTFPGPSPTARQPSLDPLCGLDSIPLLYSSSGPRLSTFRPTLPSVRITPESEPPVSVLSPHSYPQVSPAPGSPCLLYPSPAPYEGVSPPHMSPKHPALPPKPHPVGHHTLSPVLTNTTLPSVSHPHHNSHPTPPPHSLYQAPHHHHHHHQQQQPPHANPIHPPHHTSSLSNVRGLQYNTNSHNTMEQFGHCPKAREGPALSCNFCWNTTDGSGRILRRKTKYHCPECQTNLCIVPCFQQYHEAMENENNAVIH